MDLVESYRDAQQHLAARDAAAALPLLECVVADVPEDRSALRLLALAGYGTDDLAGADVLLRQVVAADPVDADAHALLGQVLAVDAADLLTGSDASLLAAYARRTASGRSASDLTARGATT